MRVGPLLVVTLVEVERLGNPDLDHPRSAGLQSEFVLRPALGGEVLGVAEQVLVRPLLTRSSILLHDARRLLSLIYA